MSERDGIVWPHVPTNNEHEHEATWADIQKAINTINATETTTDD